ncbi:MAG TPA: zinc-ribbon domain-containing protein [Thermoanaerobaculia bacterium]|nr:zinc-ribbon domain-containing protein [Thermoanaerobaculia bacterium]
MKIHCPSCRKALSIDETKLPMKEVQFPCPACKARITFDRTAISADAPTVLAQDDDDEQFADKALIVGVDSPAVRQAAKALGFTPTFLADPVAARDFYLQEYPPLVFLCPRQITQPPLQDLAPLTSVSPPDRRRAFFILVAEALRSLDGNAAFLYNVNLVVASKDLGSLPHIHRDAWGFHQKLYQNLRRAEA